MYEYLVAQVGRFPSKTAIDWGDGRLTYTELGHAVGHLARRMKGGGIGPDDRIALLLPNGQEFLVALLATRAVGATVVTLNTASKADELKAYLEDSRPVALFSTSSAVQRYGELVDEVVPTCQIHVDFVNHESGTIVEPPREDGEFALYQYSSGSTGAPKRVARTPAHLAAEAHAFASTVKVTPDDRVLGVAPFFHAHGFSNGLMAALYSGATLYCMSGFDRRQAYDLLVNKQISIFPAVPFMLKMLSDSDSLPACRLSHLRLVFTAGAALPPEIFEAFLAKFGQPIRQLYGTTEMGAITINIDDTAGNRSMSVGRPLNTIDVSVIDASGQAVAPQQIGELVVRSPAGAVGYGNHPELGKKVFRDGRYWTGDLGLRDEDGYLYVTGRKTQFINVGGNKVDPVQVEQVIETHPDVAECVVLGIDKGGGQQLVKAFVVSNSALSSNHIKEWCSDKLAAFKVPQRVEFINEIPRNPIGKVLRKYLIS